MFLVLDILLFYIFFESILLGSLFLLLSILTMCSIMKITNLNALFKTNFTYSSQLFLFYDILFALVLKLANNILNDHMLMLIALLERSFEFLK